MVADASSLPRSGRRRRGAAFLAVIFAVAVALFAPTRGDVFFTGLDDSAQCALARSLRRGAPLVARDDALAGVPQDALPLVLYRPHTARKSRDLAHQVDLGDFSSRPFFQPFLPLQRAFLPGLPWLLAFACLALCFRHFTVEGALPRLAAALATVGVALVSPWPARFCFSPYSEGPATLFAALALCLSFSRRRRASFAVGLCLGLSVTFHPTLSACALPIGAFAILRSGRARGVIALAVGSVAGLAPLVWSTKCVTAPYGDFLNPETLRSMIAASADIRSLAVALAAALPVAAVLVAAACAAPLRAFAARPAVQNAVTAICSVAALCAVAAALRLQPMRQAFLCDVSGAGVCFAGVAALCAAAFARRRAATSFLVAALVASALPFLAVQGNERFVGLWSLRRSLPFMALVPLASALAASDGARRRRFGPCAALAASCLCAMVQVVRSPMAYDGGAERGAGALVRRLEGRLRPGALYLFARLGEACPVAGAPGREVFGINDGTSNDLAHEPLSRWLLREARRRPAYVVALDEIDCPIIDGGIVLVPEGDNVRGEIRRVFGKDLGRRMATLLSSRTFTFLRVLPADSPDGAAALMAGSALRPDSALPFGLGPGAWDVPRHGKTGRWACDGAAFWGPVPAPGETIDVDFAASWWTRDGTNAPSQSLRLELPFAGECSEAVLEPRPETRHGRWRVTRSPDHSVAGATSGDAKSDNSQSADGAGPAPATAIYRIRASERYDENGFPPALAARVEEIRFNQPRQR